MLFRKAQIVACSFRYELESRADLEVQAREPLPLGINASKAKRTFHRDIYLDTPDDSLRRRGIVCRLRITAKGRRTLSVRAAAASGDDSRAWVESAVKAEEITSVLSEKNAAIERLRD